MNYNYWRRPQTPTCLLQQLWHTLNALLGSQGLITITDRSSLWDVDRIVCVWPLCWLAIVFIITLLLGLLDSIWVQLAVKCDEFNWSFESCSLLLIYVALIKGWKEVEFVYSSFSFFLPHCGSRTENIVRITIRNSISIGEDKIEILVRLLVGNLNIFFKYPLVPLIFFVNDLSQLPLNFVMLHPCKSWQTWHSQFMPLGGSFILFCSDSN